MPFPELYAALEQKAVDGQENPVASSWPTSSTRCRSTSTLTNHQYNPQSVIVSKKVWDTLSADEKKILQDAANEAARYQREQSRAAAAGILESLKTNGMQVTELSPAEVAKLRDKMKPVIAKHSASVGEATVQAMMTELAKLRK